MADRPISGFAIIPLRLFLGITFVYAAIQKLLDPGFFHAGSPTYIGAQILAFSRHSPIHGLLHHLMQFAVIVGVITVLTEGCIGLLIVLGLWTRPAALIGMALSTGFFLSASWTTYPYFFGSDIVFVVCWLTIAITGPGVFALDAVLEPAVTRAAESRLHGRVAPLLFSLLTGYQRSSEPLVAGADADGLPAPDAHPIQRPRPRLTRGEALAGSVATIVLVALGLHPRPATGAQASGTLPGSGSTGARGGTRPGGNGSIPPGARKIGNVSQLPPNTAGTVQDPATGDPAIIIHTSGSNYYAYDAVCTHAGCTVDYDSQQRMLVCPCHGGTFDPTRGAEVVDGPPPSPLPAIDMKIDSRGDIYIV